MSRTLTINEGKENERTIHFKWNSDGNNLELDSWVVCTELCESRDERNRPVDRIPHRCNALCRELNDGWAASSGEVQDFWGKHGYDIQDHGGFRGKHRQGRKNTKSKRRIVYWHNDYQEWVEALRPRSGGARVVTAIDVGMSSPPAPLS